MFFEKCCFCVNLWSGVRIFGMVLVFLGSVGIIGGIIEENQFLLIACLTSVCVNSLLIKTSSNFARLVWLLLTSPAIILFIVIGVFMLIDSDIFKDTFKHESALKVLGWGFIALAGFLAYFWVVVYSLHKKLTDGQNNVADCEEQDAVAKLPPPDYTDIVMEPPPPTYEFIIETKKSDQHHW